MNSLSRSRGWKSLAAIVVTVAVLGSLLAALSPLGSTSAQPSATHRQQARTMADLRRELARRYLNGRHRLSAHAAAASVSNAASVLSVFAQPRATSDAVPATLAETLLEATDPQQARQALAIGGNALYLIPGESGVCLVDSDRSQSGCFPLSVIRNGGAAQSTECGVGLPNSETIEVAGVVADTARQATMLFSDGHRETLAIRNNAFILDVPRKGALPTEIEVQTPSGPYFIPSTVPSDAATEHCAAR